MAELTLTWTGGRRWRLAHSLTVEWQGRRVTVPAGVRTDLASVPWWARWLVSVSGSWNRGAVVHDWLYIERPPGWTRAEADRLLRELARADGTGPVTAWIIWAAVRLGGPRW